MKLIIAIIMCFGIISSCFAELDYDMLYKDTPVLDYMYESGVDPDESKDYQRYIISPYVLVRIPLDLRNKNLVLKEGYYLIKTEKRNGYRFAVFKQNGRVAGVVPIYQTSYVNPDIIFPKPPEPKHKWYTKPFRMAKSIVQWPFKKLLEGKKPPVPPRAKADFRVVGNDEYYDMWLYVENRLYKMLFKLKK